MSGPTTTMAMAAISCDHPRRAGLGRSIAAAFAWATRATRGKSTYRSVGALGRARRRPRATIGPRGAFPAQPFLLVGEPSLRRPGLGAPRPPRPGHLLLPARLPPRAARGLLLRRRCVLRVGGLPDPRRRPVPRLRRSWSRPGSRSLMTPFALLTHLTSTNEALALARVFTAVVTGANVMLAGLAVRHRGVAASAAAAAALAIFPSGYLADYDGAARALPRVLLPARRRVAVPARLPSRREGGSGSPAWRSASAPPWSCGPSSPC